MSGALNITAMRSVVVVKVELGADRQFDVLDRYGLKPRPVRIEAIVLEVRMERGMRTRVHLVGSGHRLNRGGEVGRLPAPHVPLRRAQVNDSLLAFLEDAYAQVVAATPAYVEVP